MTYFLLLLTFFPFDTTIPLVVNKKELKWKYQQKKKNFDSNNCKIFIPSFTHKSTKNNSNNNKLQKNTQKGKQIKINK